MIRKILNISYLLKNMQMCIVNFSTHIKYPRIWRQIIQIKKTESIDIFRKIKWKIVPSTSTYYNKWQYIKEQVKKKSEIIFLQQEPDLFTWQNFCIFIW